MSHRTFMARVAAGEIANPATEIYAAADAWHDAETALPLHEWLGMTWDEYRRWGEDPTALDAIVTAHLSSR